MGNHWFSWRQNHIHLHKGLKEFNMVLLSFLFGEEQRAIMQMNISNKAVIM